MIPIKKVSPSSITTLDGCEMKWFLSYVLGYREPSGKAAALGTMGHYILECVAKSKKLRDEGKHWRRDDIVGKITKRYNIDTLIDKVYAHFSEKESHIQWTEKDKHDLIKGVEKALGHRLCPENHKTIMQTEQYFNIPIEEDWAKYSYLEKGKIKEGRLHVNGIIDLVYEDHNHELNYLDYKFGKPRDWNSGEEKTFENLSKDIQLCLYYWAVRKRYQVDNINTHIWYVNHDKPFSLFFSEEQIDIAMNKVKDTFLRIKQMSAPQPNITWKCKKFCMFSKTRFQDWGTHNVDVLHSPHDKFDAVNGSKCMCDAMSYFFQHKDITSIIENCKKRRGKKS